jgi:hypothetical protein
MKNLLIISISLFLLFLLFRFATSKFNDNFFEIFNVLVIENKEESERNYAVEVNYISGYTRGVDNFSSTSSHKSSSQYGVANTDQNSSFQVNYATNGLGYSSLRKDQVTVSGSFGQPINTGYSNSRSGNRQVCNNLALIDDPGLLVKMIQSLYIKRSDTQDAIIKSNTSSIFTMSTTSNTLSSRQNIGGPEDDGDPIVPGDNIPVGDGIWTLLIMALLYIAWKNKAFIIEQKK